MGVAILAGGLGTRLRPAVADRPKVLAPVAGRPFLCYLLDLLHRHSIRRVVLLTGHGAARVRAALGEDYRGIRLTYSVEEEPLGTAGAVRLALPLLAAPRVLLLNGDSYCDADLHAFLRRYDMHKLPAGVALARVPDTARFGRVRLDRRDRVVGFEEKRVGGEGWINAGVYLLGRELFAGLPPGVPLSLEHDLLPAWVAGRRVYGYRSRCRFLDIGTPQSYAGAPAFFAAPAPAGIDRPEAAAL